MRIGQGFDVHQLVAGRKLIIGDALLGAAALGDIGKHFADTDAKFKNIDSRILLREVSRLLNNAGFRVGNVDATIIAQAPKMAPHITQMVENIAADLGIAMNAVNVKATTTEKLGYTGRGEGIAAQAVALLLTAP
jgi:2-C-methyl-D-erythritol 2,4-cyclodiphosphate synthase